MALTLEQVLEMWKEDGKIDQTHLDGTTVKNAILHGKYLEMLSHTRLRLRKKENELADLEKDKFLYYNGKMTKDEMDVRGWPYDPFKGLVKPLKGDLEFWVRADKDLQELKMAIEYLKTLFEAIEQIMENIKWRHQAIKNCIDWRKFQEGA
jgi:hypothetical protein